MVEGRVLLSPELEAEADEFWLYIHGMLWQDAVKQLKYFAKTAKSNGVSCNLASGKEVCMCGRLLMMLHDVGEDEITTEKFDFVMGIGGGDGS